MMYSVQLDLEELTQIVKEALLELGINVCSKCGYEWKLWDYYTFDNIEGWVKEWVKNKINS